MVKFLHTADWHLGIKYAKLGPNAEKAREIRFQAVRRLLDIAKREDVDFIVIAGDLFDNNDVDRRLIKEVIELLEEVIPITVYILPGNHDPLTRDSIYLDSSWKNCSNITIFEKEEPVRIKEIGVTLYPCPVTQKQTSRDLTDWIEIINDDISIGIAHGNLQIEGFTEEVNFPINPETVEKGLDYLALGEWHSLFKYEGMDKAIRIAYPGTPETTKFGEKQSGKALIVEIENHGSQPILQEIETGILKWEEWTRNISSIEDIKHIEIELSEIKKPEYRLVNLSISGVVDQEVSDYMDSFEERYSNRFFYFNIIRDNLHLKPNLLKLRAILPTGVLFNRMIDAIEALRRCHPSTQEYTVISPQEADRILKEIAGVKAAIDASPEILDKASMLLYQLAKEEA